MTEDSNKVDPKESAAAAKVDNKAAVKKTKSAAKKTDIGKPLWPKLLLALTLIIAVTATGWLGWTEWQQRLADAEEFNARLVSLDTSYRAIEQASVSLNWGQQPAATGCLQKRLIWRVWQISDCKLNAAQKVHWRCCKMSTLFSSS